MIVSGVGGLIGSTVAGGITKSKTAIAPGVISALVLSLGAYLYYRGDGYFDEADAWKKKAVRVSPDRIRNERYIRREPEPRKAPGKKAAPKLIPRSSSSNYSEDDCRVIARLCSEKGLARSDCKVYQKHCGADAPETRTSTKSREVFRP